MHRRRFPLFLILAGILLMALPRCAQIVAPTGGPRDTLPPVLITATPPDSTLNFDKKEISLDFNEFIQLKDLQKQLIIAPNPKRQPKIKSKLRTLTVTWQDSLKPNTTYIINMGDAIEDLNEGNAMKGFRYVFSTGSYLDSLEVSGNLITAKTGQPDSTATVMLYTEMEDSVVSKEKPVYYTRPKGDGSFLFQNLPHGTFKIFVLEDANGDLQYNDSTEAIAFLKDSLILDSSISGLGLYLFKEKENVPVAVIESAPAPVVNTSKTEKKEEVKKLTVQVLLGSGGQDLKEPLQISFGAPLKTLDSSRIHLLEDTLYRPVSFTVKEDTSRKKISLSYPWKEGMPYRLILDSAFAVDTGGVAVIKRDTINFRSKKISDYGILTLHFVLPEITKSSPAADSLLNNEPARSDTTLPADSANILPDTTSVPPDTSLRQKATEKLIQPAVTDTSGSKYVVQLFQDNRLIYSASLEGNTWKKGYLNPGDYEVRVLRDSNGNGKWDRGCYYCKEKKQPERVYAFPKKFSVKANWDNDNPDLKFSFEP